MIGFGLVMAVTFAMAACGTTEPVGPSTSNTSKDPATELPIKPTPTDKPESSTTLEGITATGGFGEEPKVTFASTPWAVDSTMWEIVVQGTGEIVPTDALVLLDYYGVNARTGVMFETSYGHEPSTFPLYNMIAGFAKGVAGQKVGTRMILAIPGTEGYDGAGGQSEAGIEVGDTLVFVIDIIRSQLSQPVGETITVTDASLPKVTGALNKPVITIPTGAAPPTKLVVQELIKGTGPAAEADNLVVIDYAEYIWNTGSMVRQSYGYYPLNGNLPDLIAGWQEALVGQPMGSRLLLVVPPDMAYPQGYPRFGIPIGATMVYVVDLLYAAPPPPTQAPETPETTETPSSPQPS